jgi:hypothetical protein
MRTLTIGDETWKWQLALKSGMLIIRKPNNHKHVVHLNMAFPGSMEYDRYDQGWYLTTSIMPGMVVEYIKKTF